MFGSPDAPPKPVPVKLDAADVAVDVNPDIMDLMATAQDTGFLSPDLYTEYLKEQNDLNRRRFLHFLQAEEIPHYDLQVVVEYMNWTIKHAKGLEGQKVWVWKPLRQIDQVLVTPRTGQSWSASENGTVMHGRLYNKSVPAEAQRYIPRITKQFPQAAFLVSDYEVVKPDPFLAVVGPQIPLTVIDFWDEPMFRKFQKDRKANPPA